MNIMQHAYIWYRRCECVERKGRKLSAHLSFCVPQFIQTFFNALINCTRS